MDENCLIKKCRECKRQIECTQASCEEHNFVETSRNSLYATYKCSYCGYKEIRKVR